MINVNTYIEFLMCNKDKIINLPHQYVKFNNKLLYVVSPNGKTNTHTNNSFFHAYFRQVDSCESKKEKNMLIKSFSSVKVFDRFEFMKYQSKLQANNTTNNNTYIDNRQYTFKHDNRRLNVDNRQNGQIPYNNKNIIDVTPRKRIR